ncbi:envelope stress response membrane protein PspC [Desulfococcaceae bacterium HSG7]|nr:envelope stress response membrane protein PspC [Desulfococcaceae bacterium HSG7]
MGRFQQIMDGGLYRARDGFILGVCKGIAEFYDFALFWIRAVFVVLFIFTGFWPICVIYFVAALLMKPKPVIPLETEDDREFYDSYTHSRKAAANRLKRRYDNLERRIRRMEDRVTSQEFDFDQKLNA